VEGPGDLFPVRRYGDGHRQTPERVSGNTSGVDVKRDTRPVGSFHHLIDGPEIPYGSFDKSSADVEVVARHPFPGLFDPLLGQPEQRFLDINDAIDFFVLSLTEADLAIESGRVGNVRPQFRRARGKIEVP
jgi:hypothetical protein